MTHIISSDDVFSIQQRELIARLAGAMIPAEGDFPSASDSEVMLNIIEKLSMHDEVVTRGIVALENLADNQYEKYESSCSELSTIELGSLIDSLRSQEPVFVQLLQMHIVTSYYQNDKVLEVLGVAAGAPYPKGYDIAATDWSILDPVRARKPFYKKVDKASTNE